MKEQSGGRSIRGRGVLYDEADWALVDDEGVNVNRRLERRGRKKSMGERDRFPRA